MVTMQGHGSLGGSTNKITKARSKVVKPILKKLSYSEKGSLDLDRGWDDQQQMDGMGGVGAWEPIGTGRSAKDVSFSFGTAGARGSSGGRSALSGKEGVTASSASNSNSHGIISSSSSGGNVVRKPFQQHGRSHSGASVATNGSGGMRAGSFVHPFQQMPRTSTPPLSYANSLASFDNSNAPREYSPTITENEDDGDSSYTNLNGTSLPSHLQLNLNHNNHHNNNHHHHQHHASFSSGHQPTLSTHSSTYSQTGLRRPSLASQRTSSLSDITSALTSTPQLRVSTTGRSTPITSRLAPSKSDLHLNLTLSELESPVGSLSGTPTLASAATAPAAILASPASSATPMSPLRTSLEAMGTRLRSRSEVDSAARQEHIRQARRKFEERERAKEEKYEREEVERRNRQATKEANRIEKETREWYKATGVSSGGSGVVVGGGGVAAAGSGVNGSSVNVNLSESMLQAPASCATKAGRPSASRKTTATSIATSASVPTYPMSKSVGAGVFGGKRKGSFGMAGMAGMAGGTAAGSRPDVFAGGYSSNGSSSRKNSGFGNERQANAGDAEKGIPGFASNYDALPDANKIPRFGASIDDDGAQGYDWRRDRPRRSSMAKKKTLTYWQGFVLWLRTKIFRLSKR